jgi:gamma-glutamylcyclotransferase (GGCT)/AIG2-like uncharacterized protein YtfP
MKIKNIKNEKDNKLFVYGTLQHGKSRNYLLKGLEYEKAILLNYKKITPPSLNFPFIIRDDSSRVIGEVYYGLSQNLIHQIDMIEREGELYNRIKVRITLNSGEEVDVFTYYPSNILIEKYV